jgi:hypothetical protein
MRTELQSQTGAESIFRALQHEVAATWTSTTAEALEGII